MTQEHLSAVDRMRIATDVDASRDPETGRHLETCDDCRVAIEELRAADSVLREALAIPKDISVDALERAVDDIMGELDRHHREDAAAALATAKELQPGDRLARRQHAALSPTAGLVRQLIERAEATRDRRPELALEAVLDARRAAESLSEVAYSPAIRSQLRGLAEKEHANVLRYLGRYDDGLAAADRAATWLAAGPAAAYDLATVDYVRATILAAVDRSAAALDLAMRAAQVFDEFGDIGRWSHARMLEAMLKANAGDLVQAEMILRSVEAELRQVDDESTLAQVIANLANTATELGKLDEARQQLEQARSIFLRLGNQVAAARTDWQMAALAARAGHLDEAARGLQATSAAFAALGMPGEVAAISIELVDVRLALGDRATALAICRDLPDLCQQLGMPNNLLVALAYLRECGDLGRLDARITKSVQGFLRAARLHPELTFERSHGNPPPPSA